MQFNPFQQTPERYILCENDEACSPQGNDSNHSRTSVFGKPKLTRMFLEDALMDEFPQMINQIVIKQSQTKQEGFQCIKVESQFITPSRQEEQGRLYFSERINNARPLRFNQFSQRQTEVAPPPPPPAPPAPPVQKKIKKTKGALKVGLRTLSLKVKDIVIEQKNTTYKDVADRLILDLGHDQSKDNSKEEQNVKRRVYDALNVMIASGVLKKDGKKVLSSFLVNYKGKKRNEKQAQIEEQNMRLRMIADKTRKLSDIFTKIVSLENMVSRNKQIMNQPDKLQFPVLMFKSDASDIRFQHESRVITVLSKQRLSFEGDLDILVQMQFFNKDITFLNNYKALSEKLFKYLMGPMKDYCDQYMK